MKQIENVSSDFKRIYSKENKLLQGFTFEEYVATQLKNAVRFGKSGEVDLKRNGRKYECKFFVRKPATAKKNAIYNRCASFNIPGHDVREICEKAMSKNNYLIVGCGDMEAGAPDVVYQLNRKEAVEWLVSRASAQGDKLVFVWEAESTKSGGSERRKATLAKWGFYNFD